MNFALRWYEKQGNDFLGETDLPGLTVHQVIEGFNLGPEEFPGYVHDVTSDQLSWLQDLTGHEIRLEAHDYFIEAYA